MPTATKRGTSNGNTAGSSKARRRRKRWFLETYAADMALVTPARFNTEVPVPVANLDKYSQPGDIVKMCCRCYRCGHLLTLETMTVDRIVPGCQGGTYRRTNIRPACSGCNSTTGGATRGRR